MKIRICGDVHGKFRSYANVIRDCQSSIQVGDMGVGFRRYSPESDSIVSSANPPHDKMSEGDHHFIRGNHDNPEVCRRQRFWIPDGTMHRGFWCMGGADSVDREWRTEGLDWWPEEELSIRELDSLVDDFVRNKPRLVITHDCPDAVSTALLESHGQRKYRPGRPSRTAEALQAMFDGHKPACWLFGHWHLPFDKVIDGTRFICLPELAYIDFETEDPFAGEVVYY